jgi:glutamate-1-semialdehyde 2,1-aminomutase
MFDVAYSRTVPHNYRDILRTDEAMQRRINQRLRAGGVLRSDSKFYVSVAHTAADVDYTLAAYRAAVKAELLETAAA